MKSNIEKVYSKLPQKKHNLGKHKVDLTLIQSLNNSAEKANELSNEAIKNIPNIISEIKKSLDLMEQAVSVSKQAEIVAEEVNRLSDELGLDFNSQIDDAMQTHYKISEGYGIQVIQDLESALTSLRQ